MSLGLSGPCEVLSQQGAALAQVQDLGLLLPDQPWSWRAWPSRDPGQSLGPGLGDTWWAVGAPAHVPPDLV